MLPVAPLMIEHRLIEKMIRLMDQETIRLRENIGVSPDFAFVEGKFIEAVVDFIRNYADEIHHGKEEKILFAALAGKPLSREHRRIVQELQDEHVWGRQTTASLLTAKERYVARGGEALTEILDTMAALVTFYPRHIEKEDRHFFLQVMEYFSQEEKEELLTRMNEFDREFTPGKYQKIVADWEACGCKCHL
jgi:hemerythrin-like domain-containing protein